LFDERVQHARRLFRPGVELRGGIEHARLADLETDLTGHTAVGLEGERPIAGILDDLQRAGRTDAKAGLAVRTPLLQRQLHERQGFMPTKRSRATILARADDRQQLAFLGMEIGAGTDGLVGHDRPGDRLWRGDGIHAATDQSAEQLPARRIVRGRRRSLPFAQNRLEPRLPLFLRRRP